ncbi:MAG: TRAP transporter small permease [Alphaproteobacteria bacterium]|nr:TRAP transporter small permease [Alphaproteobacteria bacterium]
MSIVGEQERPRVQRFFDYFGVFFVVVGSLGILALLSLTVVAVTWRYLLNDPIFGIRDVASMISAVVVACAVPYTAICNSHITINVLHSHFRRPVRRLTDLVARGISAGISATATYALIKKAGCGLACGQITSNLNIPHGPFYLVLAAAMAFLSLYLLVQIWVGVMHWHREDPNEAML